MIFELEAANLEKYDSLHIHSQTDLSVTCQRNSREFSAAAYYGCNISYERLKPPEKYKLCSYQDSAIQAYAFVRSLKNCVCDKTMPAVVLGNGQYVHFYQDNIYISHDALWAFGLLQFNCVTKECVIIEYTIQRLLWLIGATLKLVNVEIVNMDYPTISQQWGDNLKQDNDQLSLINAWTCGQIYFRDCIEDLVMYLQIEGMLIDSSSIIKWISDLENTGYKFPVLQDVNKDTFCKENRIHLVPVNYSAPPPEVLAWRKVKTPINEIKASQKLQSKLCADRIPSIVNINQPWVQFDDILVLVVFNNPHYEVIPYIELLYASFFPHLLYCGPEYPTQSEFPHLFSSETHSLHRKFIVYGQTPEGHAKGALSYACLQIAILMKFNVKGYLTMADDAIVWVHKLTKFPTDAVWFLPQREVRIGDLRKLRECKLGMCDFHAHWNWWEDYQQSTMDVLHEMKARKYQSSVVYECYDQLVQLNGAEFRVNGAYSDIFYVPQRLADKYALLSDLFLKKEVFVEIAVPTILRCIESPESIQPMEGVQNWDIDTRDKPWLYFSKKYIFKKTYYHPVKWSYIQNGNQTKEYRDYLCQKLLPLMFDPYERLY